MKNGNNYLMCINCGHVMGPYTDKKMNTMDGTNCEKCNGATKPVRIGVIAEIPPIIRDARVK